MSTTWPIYPNETPLKIKYQGELIFPRTNGDNPELTRPGWIFSGWFKDSGLTQPLTPGVSEMPALEVPIVPPPPAGVDPSILVAYAKWVQELFTVNFDLQGGSSPEGSTQTYPPITNVVPNTAIVKPLPDPEKLNFAFDGWKTAAACGGSTWNFTTDVVTSNMTLYACWINGFKVFFYSLYDDNNTIHPYCASDQTESCAMPGFAYIICTAGNNVTLPDTTIPSDPPVVIYCRPISFPDSPDDPSYNYQHRQIFQTSDYYFKFWKFRSENVPGIAQGREYFPGNIFTMPAQNIEFGAIWTLFYDSKFEQQYRTSKGISSNILEIPLSDLINQVDLDINGQYSQSSSIHSVFDLRLFPKLTELTITRQSELAEIINSSDGINAADALGCLIFLTSLQITDNFKLTKIESHTFQHLQQLQIVDISNNKLSSLECLNSETSFSQLGILNASNNGPTDYGKPMYGITNESNGLSGLQHCTNLTTLLLSCNDIRDFSDLLPVANTLQDLDLSRNNCIDLSIFANNAEENWQHLRSLDISYAQKYADLEQDAKQRAHISDISHLAGLSVLHELRLIENHIPSDQLQYLPVTLTTLNIAFNNITDIQTISRLISLKELSISYPGHWATIPELNTWGYLSNNLSSTNDEGDISPIGACTHLQDLYLVQAGLTNITALSACTNLNTLCISENPNITSYEVLGNLVNLKKLYLLNNNISDTSSLNLSPNLDTLYIGAPCKFLAAPSSATSGTLHDTKETKLLISPKTKYCKFGNLESAESDTKNRIAELPSVQACADSINTIGAAHNALINLTVTFGNVTFNELRQLDLSFQENSESTKLSDISILTSNQFPNLQYLNLNDNNISNVASLSSLTNLNTLLIQNNVIGTNLVNLIDLTKTYKLSYVDISNNSISDISCLKHLKKLKYLTVENNQISDINTLFIDTNIAEYPSMLYGLYLAHNQITNVNVPLDDKHNSQLSRLDLSYNRILSTTVPLDLSHFKNLQYLNLAHNDINIPTSNENLKDAILSLKNLASLNITSGNTINSDFIAELKQAYKAKWNRTLQII